MAGRGGRPAWLRAPDPLQNPIGSRLAILGAIVLVVGGAAATLAGGTEPASGLPAAAESSPGPSGSLVSASIGDNPAELAGWYHGTEGLRVRIATEVAAVRGFLSAQNGASLRPVCVSLGTDAQAVLTNPVAPTSDARTRFVAGGKDYAAAAASCGQLFDGTRIEVGVLQQRISASLSDGDREWSALAALVGQPMATASPVIR